MIIVDEIVSADGFAARRDGSIDFFVDVDGLVDSVGHVEGMRRVSAVLLGARTYEEFSAYWPGQDPDADVNRLPKHVLSSSLRSAPWGALPPAVVERGSAADVARRLCDSYDGDVVVWGSLSVARDLLQQDAVDEIWLRVVPVLLGSGRGFSPERDVALAAAEVTAHPGGWTTVRYRVARPT
jgi:dihydrofolate reductase